MKLENNYRVNKRAISKAVMSLVAGVQPDVVSLNDANNCWAAVTKTGIFITTRRDHTTYCVPDEMINQFMRGVPTPYATEKAIIEAAAFVAQYAIKRDRGMAARRLPVDCVYSPTVGES